MFRRQQKTEPTVIDILGIRLPYGTIVETEKGRFYVGKSSRLRITDNVFKSWSFAAVPVYTERSLNLYPILGHLKFRDGSLIRCEVGSANFLVEQQKLRRITDPKWYELLGRSRNDVIITSIAEFERHELGEDLS